MKIIILLILLVFNSILYCNNKAELSKLNKVKSDTINGFDLYQGGLLNAFGFTENNSEKSYVINGISLSSLSINTDNYEVNGFELQIPGIGFFVPLIGCSSEEMILEEIRENLNKEKKLDLGFSKLNGIVLSLVGNDINTVKGLSINGLSSSNHSLSGVSLNTFFTMIDYMNGISVASLNCSTIMNGVQIGVMQQSGLVTGLQLGLHNKAYILNGVQIGLVNYARQLNGLQIGLLNFTATNITKDSDLKFGFPIINWSF